jgi:hypothetical protein
MLPLFVVAHKGQQREMTRTFDLPRQITLAASTIAGLTTRADFAGFSDITLQGFEIFVVEAFAFGAVFSFPGTPTLRTGPTSGTAITRIAPPGAGTAFTFAVIALIVVAFFFVGVSIRHSLLSPQDQKA